jgi:hypothetical protein
MWCRAVLRHSYHETRGQCEVLWCLACYGRDIKRVLLQHTTHYTSLPMYLLLVEEHSCIGSAEIELSRKELNKNGTELCSLLLQLLSVQFNFTILSRFGMLNWYAVMVIGKSVLKSNHFTGWKWMAPWEILSMVTGIFHCQVPWYMIRIWWNQQIFKERYRLIF